MIDELEIIQSLFHDLIRSRTGKLVDEQDLELPFISENLLFREECQYFPIPGMYGGFSYKLLLDNGNLKLDISSWSRIVGGSGQRHIITRNGCNLIEKGFI
jgi:hypothetical protein